MYLCILSAWNSALVERNARDKYKPHSNSTEFSTQNGLTPTPTKSKMLDFISDVWQKNGSWD